MVTNLTGSATFTQKVQYIPLSPAELDDLVFAYGNPLPPYELRNLNSCDAFSPTPEIFDRKLVEEELLIVFDTLRQQLSNTPAPAAHCRHHLSARLFKLLLGSLKIGLGIAVAILTGGTGLGIAGGGLMIISGANEMVCAVTGKTIGEHIQDRWPESIRARRAGRVVDIVLKMAGILGGGMGCGLASGINLIFGVDIPVWGSVLCGAALGCTDEIARMMDACLLKESRSDHGSSASVSKVIDPEDARAVKLQIHETEGFLELTLESLSENITGQQETLRTLKQHDWLKRLRVKTSGLHLTSSSPP